MNNQRKTALTGKSGGFQIRQDNDTPSAAQIDPFVMWFRLAARAQKKNKWKRRANHGR
jgi:hypothetical protein